MKREGWANRSTYVRRSFVNIVPTPSTLKRMLDVQERFENLVDSAKDSYDVQHLNLSSFNDLLSLKSSWWYSIFFTTNTSH